MKTVAAIAGFIFVSILTGCSKEVAVHGQAFIFQRDRETVKLSGMKIFVGRESEVTNKLQHLKQEAVGLQENAVAELKKLDDEVRTLNTQLTEIEAKIDDANRAIDQTQAFIERRRSTIADNGNRMRYMSAAARVEQARINQKWNSEIVNAEKNTIPSWETAKARAEAELESLKEKIRVVERKTAALKNETQPEELARKYFQTDFSCPSCPNVLTDSEGKFVVNVNMKERPMLIARAARNLPLGAGTEYYFWAERVTSTNVILSNENLVEGWERVSPLLKKLLSRDSE
jgi:peptidoglycan hydrolase CwlO-like protein